MTRYLSVGEHYEWLALVRQPAAHGPKQESDDMPPLALPESLLEAAPPPGSFISLNGTHGGDSRPESTRLFRSRGKKGSVVAADNGSEYFSETEFRFDPEAIREYMCAKFSPDLNFPPYTDPVCLPPVRSDAWKAEHYPAPVVRSLRQPRIRSRSKRSRHSSSSPRSKRVKNDEEPVASQDEPIPASRSSKD
jgi:hypothetical protein